MRKLRSSSIEEYAAWYIARDCKKHSLPATPELIDNPVKVMKTCPAGKMRPWFGNQTRRSIVSLDSAKEIESLVFLENEWTKKEGLVVPDGENYWCLRRVAENAIAGKYLQRDAASRHKRYCDLLAKNELRIEGENRIALCSAEECEINSNPAAQYYLLDGVGRCLPYMMLVIEQTLEFEPVEAFLAER